MLDLSNPNTNDAYTRAIETFLSNNFVDYDNLRELPAEETSDKIDDFFNSIPDYKPNSKLLKISAVRSYIEKELKIRLPHSEVRKNLAKQIPKHSTKEDMSKEEVKLFVEHFRKLYESADNSHDKFASLRNFIIVNLLAYTGQRIGDVLKISVSEAKKPVLHFKQEKSGQEVFIDNPCLSYILAYITISTLKDDDFLFANGLKRLPISYRFILTVIQRAGLLLFGKNISPHCFRKFVITELRLLGKSNAEIQSVSGHSTSAMIDYYPTRQPKIEGLKRLLE